MAIVIGPAMSLMASGNVGPICYVPNRGRYVARQAMSVIPTHTTLQNTRFAVVVACAQAWGTTLNDSQRAAWANASKNYPAKDRLGQRYKCSGYQFFMRLNVQRGMIPLSILNDPPDLGVPFYVDQLVVGPGTPIGFTQAALGNIGDPDRPDLIQYWRAGPFASPGRHATTKEFRLEDVERPASPWTFADLTPGTYWWFRARGGQDTGEIGTWFEVPFAA